MCLQRGVLKLTLFFVRFRVHSLIIFEGSDLEFDRRLGGESDREISISPASVILRLGPGVRIVLRSLGPALDFGFASSRYVQGF